MINVGRVVTSRRMSQKFTVYRKNGTWNAGRWTGTEITLTLLGVISVADADTLEQMPEGDRQKGAIVIHTQSPIYPTTANGTSDEIEWRGNRWRVSQVPPYADYGYYKAIAIKMDPSSEVTP